MSGYALCWSPCAVCGTVFPFNPHKVPSTTIFTGEREPVCAACMYSINSKREGMGLEPFPINPEAYSPCPEEEL